MPVRRLWWFGIAFRLAAICACAPALAQPIGILTLTEGKVVLIRGAAYYVAGAGAKVERGDIYATDPKGQAQIELSDGTIVNLGPASQAMLEGLAHAGKAAGSVVLLSGWMKYAENRRAGAAAAYRYSTPFGTLTADNGSSVVRVTPASAEAFVEAGGVRFAQAETRGPARVIKPGESLVCRARQSATVTGRPSADFVKSMPRHFRDRLPALADRVKGRPAEPKRERDVTYGDVEGWLKAGGAAKRNLVKRFEPRARDRDFRGKLLEHLPAHPEWGPVLFPEKYGPKNPKGK